MTKIRVHELAKEFGLASKEMEAKVRELGYDIKNYMSTLDEYQVQDIRKRLKEEATAPEKKQAAVPKTTVRRKHHVVKLRKVVKKREPSPEAEQEAERAKETQAPKVSTEAGPKSATEPTARETKEAAVKVQAGKEAVPESPAPSEDKEAGPVDKKEKERPRQERAPSEPAQPKSFVKILDRRIDIVAKAELSRPERRPKRQGAGTASKVPSQPIAEVGVPAAAGKEKKGKKKGKRVVEMSDIGRRKRKPAPKKKGALKPISKILAEEVDVEVPDSLELLEPLSGGKRVKHEKPRRGTEPKKAEKRKFAIYETIQVGELAKRMSVKVADVIKKLMEQGVMATANQALDYDTAALIAAEFDYEVEKKAVAEDIVQESLEEVAEGEMEPRPPVVTVMGHVDHGKTTLLDAIRDADVASREAGGITQHIGAYHVKLPSGNQVVFLDTPGHEAFTAMRARGAQVTDIVILVVAADDGVMAQTREAIDHAKAAGVPIIVAVNKIDKPGANPDRVRTELSEYGLVPEDWGGETIFINVSAKKGTGVEELLEMLALQAELMELKADTKRMAKGYVVEARLDKGRGPVATLLVADGTLKVGDSIVCDLYHGRIRAMLDDRGKRIKAAGPSMPVEVQGLSGVPEAGSEFVVLSDEKKAREVAEYRQRKAREAELARTSKMSLEGMLERLQEKESKDLNLVLKTDVQGSLEAMTESLEKLSTDEIHVNIVRRGIGAISESDVLLASASDAIIIGFSVKPSPKAKALAEQENVEIRFYDVIYHALEEIKSAMVGMLEPVYEEKELGRAEVRQVFRVSKVGTIAGCHVTEGKMVRNAKAKLLRDNVVVYTGKISSLKRFKEDAREVLAGYECGIGLEKFNDIKEGDVIEAYEMLEVAPVLESSSSRSDDKGEA